jgi:hypothetical protein
MFCGFGRALRNRPRRLGRSSFLIMKPSWVTVAARPAVGLFAREVRAEMTALFASTAASVSGIGPVRQSTMDAAYAGRWLPAANDGPGGELARSSQTARPPTPAGTLACSRRCSYGTWTAGRAVRLLWASGPAAVACCARRTRRGPGRPTAPDCTNFARRVRRRGAQRRASGASLFLLHAGDPRRQISRDTRCHDPPGTAAVLFAARGVRAIRRTLPPAPARSIRAQ